MNPFKRNSPDTPIPLPESSGPPESTRLAMRTEELNAELQRLDQQAGELAEEHAGLVRCYDAATVALAKGEEGEDAAALRSQKDALGDKLAGIDHLKAAAEAERRDVQKRFAEARKREAADKLQREFEQAKARQAAKAQSLKQALAVAAKALAEYTEAFPDFYQKFSEIGGPQFAGAEQGRFGNVEQMLLAEGWRFPARGGFAGVEVPGMLPPEPPNALEAA